MDKKVYSDDDLKAIAKELLESLRPKHLSVGEIHKVARFLREWTASIVLRERPAEDK